MSDTNNSVIRANIIAFQQSHEYRGTYVIISNSGVLVVNIKDCVVKVLATVIGLILSRTPVSN